MKSWLKGGLISLSIILFILITNVIFDILRGSFLREFSMLLFLLASFPFLDILHILDNAPLNGNVAFCIYSIIIFAIYFLIGSLIGGIVGLIIKKRNPPKKR